MAVAPLDVAPGDSARGLVVLPEGHAVRLAVHQLDRDPFPVALVVVEGVVVAVEQPVHERAGGAVTLLVVLPVHRRGRAVAPADVLAVVEVEVEPGSRRRRCRSRRRDVVATALPRGVGRIAAPQLPRRPRDDVRRQGPGRRGGTTAPTPRRTGSRPSGRVRRRLRARPGVRTAPPQPRDWRPGTGRRPTAATLPPSSQPAMTRATGPGRRPRRAGANPVTCRPPLSPTDLYSGLTGERWAQSRNRKPGRSGHFGATSVHSRSSAGSSPVERNLTVASSTQAEPSL